MGILRTILILVLIYYAFRIIGRFVLPFLMKSALKNAQKKYQKQGGTTTEHRQKPVGEVTIEKAPKQEGTKKRKKDKEGEYIDFEEIEE